MTNFVISYTAHFEIIGHTMIAFNRYNVFRQIKVTTAYWSNRLMAIVYSIMCIVPFFMYAYRFPFEIRYRFTDTGTGVSVSFTKPEIQKVVSYVNLSYYTINIIATLIFSIFTYQGCRKLTKKRGNVNQSEMHEMKLFVFSLCTFSCLIARYCYELTILTASFLNETTIIGYAQFVLPFIGSIYALSGSIFLLVLSSRVRRDYLHFYGIKKVEGTLKSATFIVSHFSTTIHH
uniref:Serpentine receptor class gamma n=1 Tax=Panagrolaimus superbus TaxID=310955 RepID=A0A914YV44_9BILA